MYKLYVLQNLITSDVYFGITGATLSKRLVNHHSSSKTKISKLYNAIRKYGWSNFKMTQLMTFENKADCCQAEVDIIAKYRGKGLNTYNIAKGGEGGFVISPSQKEEWKEKLKLARKGKTPAKGMKHSKENRAYFSQVSKKYWESQQAYPKDIINLSFRLAKEQYGISKTHFYRLKRAKNNELS